MKIKVSEASGIVLDWMVAKCEGYTPINHSRLATVMVERRNARGVMQPEHITSLRFSADWAQGGPIIEREKIATNFSVKRNCWFAENFMETDAESGTTPLEAAMRCYVASKLGEEVEVPNELIGE